MLRTHTNGELRLTDAGKTVTLTGWVQKNRKMGGMTFIDLRDRYGITQLVFNQDINPRYARVQTASAESTSFRRQGQ